MKKILLILLAIFITTNVYAHSTKGITPNMDSKKLVVNIRMNICLNL
jgi:hypothetical protein